MTDEDVKEWEKQLSKLRKDDDRGPRDLERRIDDLMAVNKKHQEQMASLIKENQELKKELDELRKKTINLVEDLTKCRLIIEHLDKRKIYIDINEVIKPNTFKKIVGEGIPRGKGDLIIIFDIEFPMYVDQDNCSKLEEICSQTVNIQNITNYQ